MAIQSETAAFVENLEYDNPFRNGETILGASEKLRFVYQPARFCDFAFGVGVLRRFGDERFFSRAIPLIRARLVMPSWSFTLGELSLRGGHAMPDLVYRRELVFDPGTEEGLQLIVAKRKVFADLWVDWDSLNTSEHREHFVAGVTIIPAMGKFSFPFFGTAAHSGGELFATGLPVENRFGGAGGISFKCLVPNVLTGFTVTLLAGATSHQVRDSTNSRNNGYGVHAQAAVAPAGFDCIASWYGGKDLAMPLGNPVYRTNKPLYSLEVSKKYLYQESFAVEGGIRFEFVESDLRSYVKNPQHRWWIALMGSFNHPCNRR